MKFPVWGIFFPGKICNSSVNSIRKLSDRERKPAPCAQPRKKKSWFSVTKKQKFTGPKIHFPRSHTQRSHFPFQFGYIPSFSSSGIKFIFATDSQVGKSKIPKAKIYSPAVSITLSLLSCVCFVLFAFFFLCSISLSLAYGF